VKKRSRIFKIVAILLAFLSLWIFFAPYLAERLIVEKKLEKADAIIVLGGSKVYIERTQKAAEVYRQGVSAKILLTDDGGFGGWSNVENKNLPFFELSKRQLLAQNVPESAIEIVKPEGDGTNYEAENIAGLANERGWKSVEIVTSGYHTSRALWTFEKFFSKNGLEIEIGIVSPLPGIQTPQSSYWWYSIDGWSLVAGEYMKFAYYSAFL
jgi:uncharacterized SAM-binding protein YcdF (DUF218 family)